MQRVFRQGSATGIDRAELPDGVVHATKLQARAQRAGECHKQRLCQGVAGATGCQPHVLHLW